MTEKHFLMNTVDLSFRELITLKVKSDSGMKCDVKIDCVFISVEGQKIKVIHLKDDSIHTYHRHKIVGIFKSK